jgi:hypothetical protein
VPARSSALLSTPSARLNPEAQRDYESATDRLGDYSRQRALASLKR